MDIFAERFKQLKNAHSLTYPQIAEQIGVTTRQVKGYAAGTSKPDYFKLIALADYFGCSIDYLVGRTDAPVQNPE